MAKQMKTWNGYEIVDDAARKDIASLEEQIINYDKFVATEITDQLDGMKVDVVQEILTQIGGIPVFGTIDDENTITVTTSLPNGVYTLKYEDGNGALTEIGTVEVTDCVAVVTYTNQIPISIDTDGSIYNGTGYKKSTRINSSGQPKDLTTGSSPAFATGFIPISANGVIEMKDCYIDPDGVNTVYGDNAGGLNVRIFDSSKTLIGGATWANFVEGFSNSYFSDVVMDDNGNTIGFKVVLSNVAFIRLTLGGDAEKAVVTVNEKIS